MRWHVRRWRWFIFSPFAFAGHLESAGYFSGPLHTWLLAPGCDCGEHPIDEKPYIYDGIQFGRRKKVVAGLNPDLWLLAHVDLVKAYIANLCGEVVEFGYGQRVAPSVRPAPSPAPSSSTIQRNIVPLTMKQLPRPEPARSRPVQYQCA